MSREKQAFVTITCTRTLPFSLTELQRPLILVLLPFLLPPPEHAISFKVRHDVHCKIDYLVRLQMRKEHTENRCTRLRLTHCFLCSALLLFYSYFNSFSLLVTLSTQEGNSKSGTQPYAFLLL